MNPSPSERVNHFAVLGLPPAFALDRTVLDERYRTLQAAVHPDRFATASPAERQAAIDTALRVNAAYRVLADPVARAAHLLELIGIEALGEGSAALPSAFLAEQMAWREQLEEARGDEAALERLRAQCAAALEREAAAFAAAYPVEVESARFCVRKMRFIQRLIEALDQELTALAG
ncbi:MAG: Fe-S protein assembly co-chaperone HscB [Casimicrobiaceae bacterium]|nr:Fe-S protein assembly co-chaperone HscB [Casimicrobiaceae bacterium]MCX8098352.1 Fe-S protein assembly co-chaperone HscB [Casimicrobiaceae bacterium]MDW8312532.1 Fe-S protein assembly co-chaperone HscB [Burkholderiales bacterium]